MPEKGHWRFIKSTLGPGKSLEAQAALRGVGTHFIAPFRLQLVELFLCPFLAIMVSVPAARRRQPAPEEQAHERCRLHVLRERVCVSV